MGKRAFAVWLCLATCVAAATPTGEPDDWRILCSRQRPQAFVGSIETVKTPRVGLEGTYRLRIAPGAAGPGIASIEWILPAASDAPRDIPGASVSGMAGFTTATTVRVVRPGDYQIVALVRAHGARAGTPATVFVRYLRVRPEGSFDSATPFPHDPAYVEPFASNIVIKRQVGVDAAETRYSGSLSYHDDTTGFQEPIREAQVRLVERVTEGAFLVESNVHTLMTDVDGRFEFPPVLAANADGSARVYRLRALLDNDTLSLSPSSGGAYERDTEFADAEPGAALDYELRWERADASHMAGHVFSAVLDARDFLITGVGFTRDKIPVLFPSAQDATFYAAESRRGGALGDERMEIAFEHANDRTAMLHEYGHAVMTPLYGNRFDAIPFGDFDGPHKLSTVSDEEFAISEGWAEFMAAAVDDDALNVTSFINSPFPNIETNFWHTGRDIQVGRNTEGENVEGAVASVLWDITDGPDSNDLAVGIDDDGIDSQFQLVWTIFGEARPYTILTVRDEWLSRDYPLPAELVAIFEDHSITPLPPVLAFELGALPPGVVREDYRVELKVLQPGVALATTFDVTGLPDGITADAATGVLEGSPTLAGDYEVTVRVTDRVGQTAEAVVSLVVDESDEPPPANVSLVYDGGALHVGDTYRVQVAVADVLDIAGYEASVEYDGSAIRATGATEGELLADGGADTFWQAGNIDSDLGVVAGITATRLSPGGVDGEGVLFSVVFVAVETGDAGVAVTGLRLGDSAGEAIPHVAVALVVTIDPFAAADVNRDGSTDILDLILVAQSFGVSGAAAGRADVDGDGRVSIVDLVTVAQHFGESSQVLAVASRDGLPVHAGAVRDWLWQARQANDGSVKFRVGIEALESLLRRVTPPRTRLLPNYPNPFNPETWIPFDLADAADVLVTVYDSRGRVVRSWDLGRRDAGAYTGRDGAVYWDGRSATGDVAASGSYYVELRAGEHASVRRILLAK